MESSLVLWSLAIAMMFTVTHSISTSRSCSTVNGKTICTSEQSNGNYAGASSGAFSNGQGYVQQTAAGTGNTYTGAASSSQSSSGNLPRGSFTASAPGGFNPFAFVNQAFGGGFGGGAFAFAGRR